MEIPDEVLFYSYKPPLYASHFKKEKESSPVIEITKPALKGVDQNKLWVGLLGKLTKVRRC